MLRMCSGVCLRGQQRARSPMPKPALGVTFPDDVRASYRIHNGQRAAIDEPVGLIDGWELLSLEGMCQEWCVWEGLRKRGDFDGIASTPNGSIKPDWWNPAWIPLTNS